VQLTSFVGRERELAEVQALVRRHRLVTLTGAGGCGKTRLALHVAADLLEAHADGAWFVDLAPVADEALIARVALSELGAREVPGQTASETLMDYLRARSLLLVLDNCEHVVASCAALTDALLRACPGVRVVATSREPLGVVGEATWRVPSLGLPPPQAGERDILGSEAVLLFVERARLVQPGFEVSTTNAAAVAQLCRRLDGIPLALELAAARVRGLTVEQIVGRLHDRFRLLTGGSRTALRRQQTLRALVDWSYDLLSEDERALLRCLSVFVGGWTLEAAEAVSADLPDALGLLLQLVDKSLVTAESDEAEARYRLLETIRQYAQEKLHDAGEAAAARDRHRDYYLSWAERAAPEVVACDQLMWHAQIEAEHDNLRTAIEWSAGDGTDRELRLCAALAHFWAQRGYAGESSDRLAGALERGSSRPTRERAIALDWAGQTHSVRFDFARARELCREAIAVARASGERRAQASALRHLATQDYAESGSTPAVRAAFEEAVAVARAAAYPREVGYSLSLLGQVTLDLGDEAAGLAMLAESRRILREVGDRDALSMNLQISGGIALARGEYAAARELFEEALVISYEMGAALAEMGAQAALGDLARAEGDLAAAHAHFAEVLRLGHANGARSFLGPVMVALRILAGLSVATGDPRRGVRIFGAEAAARGAETTWFSIHVFGLHSDTSEEDLLSARSMLDEATFAACWSEGQAMTLDDAIAYALEAVPAVA
jgi:predicted ATPase